MVYRFLRQAAINHPEVPALRDGRGRWTYRELYLASETSANWLMSLGVTAGDRVTVRAVSDRTVVALMYGCFRLGAVFVPLHPELRSHQVEHTLTDTESVLFIADESAPRNAELQGFASLREAREMLSNPPLLDTMAIGTVHDPGRDELALLLYTSGSTARPKAVSCPHGALAFVASAIASQLVYMKSDVVFCRLPLSFDYGLYQVFLSVLANCELVLEDSSVDTRLISRMREVGATVVPIVPSLATMLLALRRRDSAPTQVRLFTNTGERLSPVTAERLRHHFPGAVVQLMFGITECKRISIMEPDGDRDRPGAVGRPLPGTVVDIRSVSGRVLSPGLTGEITVRGPHLMQGYWRAPDITARTYCTDPHTGERVLYTGDYGRLDHEGYLYFEGRRDQVFKRRGVRMSVAEIEASAQLLSGVRMAAVLPPGDGRDVSLFISGDTTPERVLAELSALLEPSKVPSICHVFTALPLTANGKVDRERLHTLGADL